MLGEGRSGREGRCLSTWAGLGLVSVVLLLSGANSSFAAPAPHLPVGSPSTHGSPLGTAMAGATPGSLASRPAGAPAADWFDLSSNWSQYLPGERTFSAMAYDPALDGILIFGGYNNSGVGADGDTWLFTNGQWENLTPTGSTQPPARWAALLAWDPVNQEMVLFGGRNSLTELNDTWTYGSAGWTQLLPATEPSARQQQFSLFAYDPTLHADYLYGGICFLCFPANYNNDSWTFVNGSWTNITTSVTGGPAFLDAGAWNPTTSSLVAYTSNRTDCTGSTATMSFNGTAWNVTGANSSPGPVQEGDGFVYDSLLGGMLLYGGTQGGGCSGAGETWTYVNGTWTDLTSNLTSSPGGRCCESVAYDPTQKVVVLLGGTTNTNTYVRDTWSFPAVPLTLNLTTSSLTGVAPFAVQLAANVTGGAGALVDNWSFGDGTPNATTASVNHTYATNGTYGLNFTVEDAQGREINRSLVVRVGNPLTSGASAHPASGEAPVRVNFTGSLAGGVGPYTFAWAFGDGTNGVGLNASHVYRAGGNYSARLTVKDGSAQTSVATVNVSIADPLGVGVVTSPGVPSGETPFVVNFSARPTGTESPFSATWSFGDGTPNGSGLNVSHQYVSAGTFDANVTVTDLVGHEANSTVVVTVVGGLAAQASTAKTVGLVPFSVRFVGTSSGGTGPYTYHWTFGDGSNATGDAPTHVYTVVGEYLATLTVTDSVGAVALSVVPIHAVAPAVVTAHASVLYGLSPLEVSFTSSTTGGLGPLTFDWAFGDSGTAVGQNVSHRYVGAHTYTAGVTVSDALNELVDASVEVQVFPTFVATLSVDQNPIDLGQSINFTASALGGSGTPVYSWTSLPPGCPANNGPSISCTPTIAGTYNVSVLALDSENDNASASVVLTVVGAATPTSSASPATPIVLWGALGGAVLGGAALGALVSLLGRRRSPAAETASPEPPAEVADSGEAGLIPDAPS
ncbi:MAG: PKD domain-containing protein [Thermoplasmata archaeon]|nr:PKD domain-containing protein [Thermoplasmata archaeon]